MQYEDFFLAWWFNVGVQIFLCISGYLYGQKNVGDITVFYGRRFKKILIPYYIVFIIAGMLELFFFRNDFNIVRFGIGLFCGTTISGGEHLWFVSLILFCYVLTPILCAYRDLYIRNSRSLWFGTTFAVTIAFILGALFCKYYNPAWLSCYVIGYALGTNEKKKLIKVKIIICLFGIISVIGNGIQIYCNYVKHITFSGYINTVYQYFCDYNHVWLGIFLFLLMKVIFGKIDFSKHGNMIRLLNLTDNYSYEMYLVHQFLILGPFSLMALTSILPLNIMIILIGIGVLTWLLKIVETLLMKQLSCIGYKK